MSLYEYVKNIFSRKNDESVFVMDVTDLIPPKQDIEIYIPENRIISNFKPNKKNILIIDDSKGVTSIVEDYLSELINLDDYNILTFYGVNAAFVMKSTLKKLEDLGLEKIDYAVLDIVLPGKIKVNDSYEKMDGIDVAIYLNKLYAMVNFIFYSGNIVNSFEGYIQERSHKFKEHFNKNLRNFIMIKGKADDEVLFGLKKLLKQEQ